MEGCEWGPTPTGADRAAVPYPHRSGVQGRPIFYVLIIGFMCKCNGKWPLKSAKEAAKGTKRKLLVTQ